MLAVLGVTYAIPTHNGPRSLSQSLDFCAQAYSASLVTSTRYFPASLALACLQQLPYDQSIAENTIESFQTMFELYATGVNVKQSANKMTNLSVDILTELQKIQDGIKAQNYTFFEYQYTLDYLVEGLNDGTSSVEATNIRKYILF
jgi:hypothetical protein